MPTHLLLDAEISIEARGLLAVLCAVQKADLDMQFLREKCGVGRDKLAEIMGELAAYGVVRLLRGRGEAGRVDGSTWHFVGGQL